MPDVRELLQDAAGDPFDEPDLAAVRRRAGRRIVRRRVVTAAVALVALAAPLALASRAGGPDEVDIDDPVTPLVERLGVGWERMPGEFSDRGEVRDVVVHDDRVIAVGEVGGTPAAGGKPAAWVDGEKASIDSVDLGLDGQMQAVATWAGGLVAVGQVGDVPAAWSSPDGASWVEARIDSTGLKGHLRDVTSDGADLLVAVGVEDPSLGETSSTTAMTAPRPISFPLALTSTDGRDWHRAAFPSSERGSVHAVGQTGQGFVAVGGSDGAGAMWQTTDGSSWEGVDVPGDATSLALVQGVTNQEEMTGTVIAGWDRFASGAVWRSSGSGWDRQRDEAFFGESMGGFAAGPEGTLVGVTASDDGAHFQSHVWVLDAGREGPYVVDPDLPQDVKFGTVTVNGNGLIAGGTFEREPAVWIWRDSAG